MEPQQVFIHGPSTAPVHIFPDGRPIQVHFTESEEPHPELLELLPEMEWEKSPEIKCEYLGMVDDCDGANWFKEASTAWRCDGEGRETDIVVSGNVNRSGVVAAGEVYPDSGLWYWRASSALRADQVKN